MTKKTAPSPFPPVARTVKARQDIDPDLLKVEHDTPLPRFKSRNTDKYGPVFSKLKPGSCVVCLPDETPRIAQSLRKVLELGKYPVLKDTKVVSRHHCDDGHGRVWLMSTKPAKK